MANPGDPVRDKRLGWRGDMDVSEDELYDPYDYPDDTVEGIYERIVLNEGGLVPVYTNHLVDGQVVDPETIEVLQDAVTAAANTNDHDGAMIALVPTEEDLDRLALEGGEPRDVLHLTLWFLGAAEDWDPDQRDVIIEHVQAQAQRGLVHARGFGANLWNANTDNPSWNLAVGDDPDATGLGLEGMRSAVEPLPADIPEQHSPWVPHVCLAYSSDEALVSEIEQRLGPITFDRLRVAFGGETTDVPLAEQSVSAAGTVATEEPVASSSLEDRTVPWHIVPNHSKCSSSEPYAVVKDSDGSVEGCHTSRDKAEAQLAALYASEEDMGDTTVLVSNAPWNGSASRFTDEQYQRSTAACDSGDEPVKQRCFLPHHEPGGELNRNGLARAAGRITSLAGRSAEAVSSAKGHLRRHYGEIDEEPPDNLKAAIDWHLREQDLAEDAEALAKGDYPQGDCPPGQHMIPGGDCVPDDEATEETEAAGGKPNPGTNPDKRLKQNKNKADADAVAFEVDDTETASWHGVLVVEGVLTGDGREFAKDSITWADPPLPLRWKKEDAHGGENDVTVTVGRIDRVWRDGSKVMGAGVFDMGSEDGQEAHRRMGDGFLKGVSIDADDIMNADVEYVFPEAPVEGEEEDSDLDALLMLFAPPDKIIFHAGRIRAATLVDIPAFVEAYLELTDDEPSDTLAASAATGFTLEVAGTPLKHFSAEALSKIGSLLVPPQVDEPALPHGEAPGLVAHALPDQRPPRAWFNDPGLSVYVPITVTDDGRVYGHAARWGECHMGYMSECIVPPREPDHPYFMTGEVVCADGSRVSVGQITAGIAHAPMYATPSKAQEHYDNTSAVVADVATGNDRIGIWVAGWVRPSADAWRVHALRASGQVSPDWRRIGGQLRMVALLTVNVSGYQVPRARAFVASGEVQALVAAGMTNVTRPKDPLRTKLEELQQRVVPDTGTLEARRRALSQRVHPSGG